MKYKNSLCDGCGLPFKEEDDVVVCPECGTPQHRECYKKNNCCVNEHRHGESFEWNNLAAPAESKPVKAKPAEDMLPCPSCGHLNPKDAKNCENCSMRLIVFGMNLAEYKDPRMAENENNKDDSDGYPPPFTLGQGEGFEYDNIPPSAENTPPAPPPFPPVNPQLPPMPPAPPVPPVPPMQYGYGPNGYAPPQPDAKQFFLSRFIGTNYQKFMHAFNRLESGKALTFNWAAFFFPQYWFFYRKLYKPGIIFTTVLALISIIFAPVSYEFSLAINELAEITDQAAYMAFIEEMYATVMPRMFVAVAVETAIKIIAAVVAYPLYKKYTEASLHKIKNASSPDEAATLASRLGGTSAIGILIGWAALFVVELICSSAYTGSLF